MKKERTLDTIHERTADILQKKSPEQISYNMSRIKNKDSVIENLLRKELWKRGLRYRKNYGKVAGKPDIVFP